MMKASKFANAQKACVIKQGEETMIGLFKTEVINRLGPRKSKDQVDWETLKWADWFNTKLFLEPLGYITPQEAEDAYYQSLNTDDTAA